MTEFSAVSMRIETAGDREALRALDSLDKKGQQIVDNFSAATGRAMGDVAKAYVSGGRAMRSAIESVSDAWKQQQSDIAATARAADALEARQAHSIATATRGLEMIGRTGQLTGRSLDAVVGQISAMAFSFGPTGQIVAAIGITTAAVVELFMRTAKEARKLREETEKEFSRIAHMDVAQQGDEAARLYSGDKYAERKVDRLSVPQIKARMAALQASLPSQSVLNGIEGQFGNLLTLPSSSPYHKAGEAMRELDELDKELDKRENLLRRINGINGSMADAGKKAAAVDHWSFLEDDAKNAARDAKDAARGAKTADAVERALDKQAHKLAAANNKIGEELAVAATKSKKAREAVNAGAIEQSLVGWQSKTKLNFDIWNAPFEEANKALEKHLASLQKQLESGFGRAVGQGIASGIQTALSTHSISDGFAAVTASVLGSIGSTMISVGEEMVGFGGLIDGFVNALVALNGGSMVATGIELIAAGAVLTAMSGGISGSLGRGGAASGGSSSLGSVIDRGTITPGSYSSVRGSDVPARPQINNYNTILGPNDPQLPRFFDEVNRKSLQRGTLSGGR